MIRNKSLRTGMSLKSLRALLLALVTPILVSSAYALNVGGMAVNSKLGEPLAVSIALSAQNQSELDSLRVKLAPRVAFDQNSVPYPLEADDIQFAIEGDNGSSMLRVYTQNALDTPYLHLLMQLSWSGGNMLREFVVLIDPASYGNTAEASADSNATLEQPSKEAIQSSEWVTVVSGDTVSSIAQRYRPNDVSVQQAWMAFFNLNRDVFPSNNINMLKEGARLKIPTRDQMLELTQQKAANEVKPLISTAVSKKPVVKPEIAEQVAASVQQDVLTIGANTVESPSSSNGLNSSAMEELLEGGLSEISSISSDMGKFSEELAAARGENKVVADRLSQVESQLSKLNQLLELQNQTLAVLNEQARLQAKAMQETKEKSSELEKESQRLKDLAAKSQEQMQEAQLQVQQQAGESILTVDQPLDSTFTSISASSNNSDSDSKEIKSQEFQADAELVNEQNKALLIEEEQRIAKTVELAALQQKAAEARKKQYSQAELDQDSDQSFLDTSDWTGSVVSAKNKISGSIKVNTDKLSESSLGASIIGILSRWGLYILAGILALVGLGSFMRRRGGGSQNQNSEFDSEIDDFAVNELNDDSIDIELNDKNSSIFSLSEDSMIQSESAFSEPLNGADSSLFAVDQQDSMVEGMESEMLSQQSTIGQVMDVDPLAEAEVYLAYDRKEQAVKVLNDAYAENPKDQDIAIKLMNLHQEANNQEAFGKVLETAYDNKDESTEGDQWLKIKSMGKAYFPTHSILRDNDFDSSIPILLDEIDDENSELLSKSTDSIASNAKDTIKPNSTVSSTLNSDESGFNEDDSDVSGADLQPPENEDILVLGSDLELIGETETFKFDDEESGIESPSEDPESIESFILDMDSEIDGSVKQINQHDTDTSFALAKAYIDLGEENIAKGFLKDVIESGSIKFKEEAKKLLKGIKA